MTAVDAAYRPACGAPLELRVLDGRERRVCPACDRVVWRNPAPGTQVAVRDAESVLLVRRGHDPAKGRWALPGGHTEAEESPAAAAVRELAEETGVRVDPGAARVVATNGAMFDGERYSVTFGFVADRREAEGDVVADSDATDARVVSWEECAELDPGDSSDPLLEAVREASAAGCLD